jgi:hypothetical protein
VDRILTLSFRNARCVTFHIFSSFASNHCGDRYLTKHDSKLASGVYEAMIVLVENSSAPVNARLSMRSSGVRLSRVY